MLSANRPVEKVIANRYHHWRPVIDAISPASPKTTANASAKKGTSANRAAVVWAELTPLSEYFESAVEIPQLAAAPIANKAAIAVSSPVSTWRNS